MNRKLHFGFIVLALVAGIQSASAQTFALLHSFIGSDGANPVGSLIVSNGTFYGMTSGRVFKINMDGSGFSTLHSFPATSGPNLTGTNSDGATLYSSLILSDNTLYGAAHDGGGSGNGTVFTIFIQPQLTIIPSGASMILTWPTNYNGFTLQSATNLVSPVWTTNSAVPVVVNGQNTVTNSVSGNHQFFRLSQ